MKALLNGRCDKIRTCDPLHPMLAVKTAQSFDLAQQLTNAFANSSARIAPNLLGNAANLQTGFAR
jgi:hypothetical protein